jgi:hypothetical protein
LYKKRSSKLVVFLVSFYALGLLVTGLGYTFFVDSDVYKINSELKVLKKENLEKD